MSESNFVDIIDLIEIPPAATKIAVAWNPHPTLVDPLDNNQTSPHKAVPEWEHRGKSFGENAGTIGGGLTGLALPALAGMATGVAGAYGLEHLMGGGNVDFHDHFTQAGLAAGGLIGAGMAAPIGAMTAPIGAGVGALMGKQTGGFAGRQLEHMYSPERQAAERIRRLPANHGLALIRTMEQSGRHSPQEIEAMKSTYNARREGLRDQARAMVI